MTLQGEGPYAGRPAVFLRLGRCNLDCKWCDTPYTWDWDRHDPAVELGKQTVAEVVRSVAAVRGLAHMLVVTGGEPLLQAAGCRALIAALRADPEWAVVQFETNGTRPPLIVDVADDFVRYVVSPKLSSSGVDPVKAIKPDVLQQFVAIDAHFKFVIADDQDVRDMDDVVRLVGIDPRDVWLMPEGIDNGTLNAGMRRVAETAVARGMNACTRLHVLAWGNERGR